MKVHGKTVHYTTKKINEFYQLPEVPREVDEYMAYRDSNPILETIIEELCKPGT